MGKGGGGAEQEVNEYYMTLQYGICTGPVILREILIDDKVIWQGRMSEQGAIYINDPYLFGGPKKEGGVMGTIYFLPGKATQIVPNGIAARMGLTTDTCPAYRGKATLFFVGSETSPGGFLWTSNSPFIRPVKVKVERAPEGLNPEFAMIGDNANPIHMIYEYLTSTSWGMGAAPYLIDLGNFEAVAQAIYNEQFMLSVYWTQQDTVEKFVSEILDHILATLFVNPATGLLSIMLLRDDYNPEELRQINPSNARLKKFSRKLWGETVNEISVAWTNPATEQSETVTVHDLANMEIQGTPVSETRNYYAIRSAELATRVAARDSRSASAPLATIEVELDRSSWNLLPGQVVRVTWPKYKLFDTICRVMNIKYGKPGSPEITATLVEDVFSLSRPMVATAPSTGAQSGGVVPAPMAHSEVFTLPYFLASREVSTEPAYPAVIAGVLGYQPDGATASFDLAAERLQPNGTFSWQNVGTKTAVGRAATLTPVYAEAVTQMGGLPLTGQALGPQVNGFALLGAGGDALHEMVLLEAYDGTNWTLRRGVLDTVPRAWPTGTPIWFIPPLCSIGDTVELRSVGESPEYRLLSRTSRGLLAIDDAPIITGAMTARPHAPLRPANVTINGQAFGEVNAAGATQIVVNWSTRNRLNEDTIVLPWTAGAVTPEYLQMTIVTVFRENGTPMIQWRGLYTENSLNFPIGYVQEEESVFIRVTSERSGISSLQGHGMWVRNIPQVPNPAPPPTPSEPPPPGPPDDEPDPTPDPVPGPTGTGPVNPLSFSFPAEWN